MADGTCQFDNAQLSAAEAEITNMMTAVVTPDRITMR